MEEAYKLLEVLVVNLEVGYVVEEIEAVVVVVKLEIVVVVITLEIVSVQACDNSNNTIQLFNRNNIVIISNLFTSL